MTRFDVAIIGAGPGGYVAAIRAAQLGLKVAIVEREHLGGICLNWGCIPTKALLRTSELYTAMRRASEFGLAADNVRFDLARVVERSRKVAERLSNGVAYLMKKNKITVIDGTARLQGGGRIAVTGKGGETLPDIEAEHIIVATGARARVAAGARARRQADLDLQGGDDPGELPELAADRRLRRHRHRVRELLSQPRRRGDGGRDAAPHPARRG